MSSDSLPITAARFASALTELSLSSLYLKVAELRNSIAHLEKSNSELEEFVREQDDRDCYEALMENKEVIKRMEERIGLIKKEVIEIRGLPWQPEEGKTMREVGERPAAVATNNGTAARTNGAGASTGTTQQQNGGTAADEEEGVFL